MSIASAFGLGKKVRYAVVGAGDITQRATAAQFASARDWLARLPVPHRLVIGGNHDIPLFDLAERLRHPYRRLSAAFGAEREPRLDLPDWQVLTLDTTRWWRHRDGTLSRAQIARTADALQAACCLQLGPEHVFLTGDRGFRKVAGLCVQLVG